jgi:NAD(P)H-hydrate epimerase
MGAPKVGLLLNEGPVFSGRVLPVEIGIPEFILDRFARAPHCAWIPGTEDVAMRLPHRGPNAHKYRVGGVLVVAGSPGLTGAPVLASESALRVGAGAVVCACPESIQPILSRKMTEVMTEGLPDPGGELDFDVAMARIRDRATKARALLVGCGLGRTDRASQLVTGILHETDLVTVVDADGLFALAGNTDLVRERSQGRWILTPHKGEFDRLTGEPTDWNNRIELARQHAARWNCILVLKGLPSVVASPDGNVYVSPTGNAALATAGTGDVLAGAIAGFAAQGLPPIDAAIAGLYAGGRAADTYARDVNAEAMIASDLVGRLPEVLRELDAGQNPETNQFG